MVHWRIVASSKNSQSASLRTIRTQLLALPLQSSDASYLLLEHKSVQLMNISLLQHLFCYATQMFKNGLRYMGIPILRNTTIKQTDQFCYISMICSDFVQNLYKGTSDVISGSS